MTRGLCLEEEEDDEKEGKVEKKNEAEKVEKRTA